MKNGQTNTCDSRRVSQRQQFLIRDTNCCLKIDWQKFKKYISTVNSNSVQFTLRAWKVTRSNSPSLTFALWDDSSEFIIGAFITCLRWAMMGQRLDIGLPDTTISLKACFKATSFSLQLSRSYAIVWWRCKINCIHEIISCGKIITKKI